MPATDLPDLLPAALGRRRPLLDARVTDALRLFGAADGLPGLRLDLYGSVAVLAVDAEPGSPAIRRAERDAHAVLALLEPVGARTLLVKPFPKDRSRLGAGGPGSSAPEHHAAGEPPPDRVVVTEHGVRYEVRPAAGFSVGLFLDQREHRRLLGELILPGQRVLNTFAYTCGFSVACARAGALTTSVDVARSALDRGRRNFELNAIDAEPHFFTRADAAEFLALAGRRGLVFDLVVLDPPTFGSASKRRGVKPFSATRDYPALVAAAERVLAPDGLLFASTNCRALCAERGAGLDRALRSGLSRRAEPVPLPPRPIDLAGDGVAVAHRLLRVRRRT